MDCDAARRPARQSKTGCPPAVPPCGLSQYLLSHRAIPDGIIKISSTRFVIRIASFYAPQKSACRVGSCAMPLSKKLDITADRSDRCFFSSCDALLKNSCRICFSFSMRSRYFLHIPRHPRRRVRDDIDLLIRAFFKLKTRVVVVHPHHFAGNFLQRTRD